ncbi:hypothetical protein C0Q70_14549 [Pomacea canaliculata]|uniref:Ubiquitin thioesterase OTU n=1 Tax=Pomacea canaliculata TaxID=400727 RepID=A0A2T7NSC4_POMCA|nr:ubiquitin thioesterase OTU1-like [Pomacea canaliculata]PVD24079.1 hypothetical protein C0Q70_14549 [Pomacea canaliculata]
MAGASFRLGCQTALGLKVVHGLTPDSTVADLLSEVSHATTIPVNHLRIKYGFPPRPLDTTNVLRTLSDLQVRSGDKLTVEDVLGGARETPPQAQSLDKTHVTDGILQQQLTSSRTQGMLQRRVVPADNSCLFTAINALMTDGTVDASSASALRQVIADVVASDDVRFCEAFLGRPNKQYVQWILNSDAWGGGIELAILADHYKTEIAVVDCQSARIDRFGEDKNYPQRIFLLYDGVHYDILLLESADGSGTVLQTIFSTSDDNILLQAMDIAREAQSTGQFTNTAEFSLHCLVCRVLLKGQKEAQQHAAESGHSHFGEHKANI